MKWAIMTRFSRPSASALHRLVFESPMRGTPGAGIDTGGRLGARFKSSFLNRDSTLGCNSPRDRRRLSRRLYAGTPKNFEKKVSFFLKLRYTHPPESPRAGFPGSAPTLDTNLDNQLLSRRSSL